MKKMVKTAIGLIQMRAVRSPELNLATALERVSKAAQRGAQIISLEELFQFPYFPQTRSVRPFRFAEWIPGPTTDAFSQLARRLKVVLIVPLFERGKAGRYYNTAVVINADGKILGRYRKMHLPNDPGYYEKFYFATGNSGVNSVHTKYGKIGVLICWDQWFPEAARLAASAGAEILFYPTAIGWRSNEMVKTRHEEREAWETIQRAHAIANGIYVAAVNRVGREGKLQFWGGSFVAGPFGEVVAQASTTREEILIAECDLTRINRVRKVWPFLKERRIVIVRQKDGGSVLRRTRQRSK